MSKVVIRKNGVNQQQNTVFIGGSGGGHTIQNPSGTDMAQEDKLQFTGNVTVTDDSTNGRTVVEVTDSGHTIENSAGTKLTQRDVMQVLDGLEAVDDSTNQKTKIKMNLPIVSSADWNAMTEQEKTAYKASHYRFGVEVPDTEGVINAEYMKLLWENPNTTQAFASQTITLNSADYDFLLIVHRSVGYNADTIIEKGMNALAQFVAGTSQYSRVITRINDTQYSVGDGNSGSTVTNTVCVPIAIYGIKKNFQFKVNAIATDLSTRADHCFLSDNETTVEDKLEELENNSFGSIVNLSLNVDYTAPCDGYVRAGLNGGGTGSVGVMINNESLLFIDTGNFTIQTLFVRKGSVIKAYTLSNASARFIPLI